MSDERKPVANITPFGLRMQPDLKRRVEEAAKSNNRSMNAEIVSRLEHSFISNRESEDWRKLADFYSADERYIVDEYYSGKSSNPSSGVTAAEPETEFVKEIREIVSRRSEIVAEVVFRELEKRGMLTGPGEVRRPSRQLSPGEMKLLQNAPAEVVPEVLEHLGRNDVDAALLAVYRAKEKNA